MFQSQRKRVVIALSNLLGVNRIFIPKYPGLIQLEYKHENVIAQISWSIQFGFGTMVFVLMTFYYVLFFF